MDFSLPPSKLLTIAIPTYNRIDQLRSCLNSILKQVNINDTWIEILVIDNNSPDGTYDYMKTILHPSFRPMQNDVNIGAENNILKVTSEAKGKYVFWLSDDDLLLSGVIEYLKTFLRKLPESVGWVFSPLPTYDYLTGDLLCNIHPTSNYYHEIKPSYFSVLKYARYGWAFSRQIFSRQLIDEEFLKGSSGNMYFILSIPTQMLMQYHSIYIPKALVAHTYGNHEFWEEFGHDLKLRRAKASLDYAAIIPKVLRYIAKSDRFKKAKASLISIAWVNLSAKSWVFESLPHQIHSQFFYLFKQSRITKTTSFFIFYTLNIAVWIPYELSILVLRKLVRKLLTNCR